MIQEPKDLAGFQALETQIKAVVHKVLPAVVGIQIGGAWQRSDRQRGWDRDDGRTRRRQAGTGRSRSTLPMANRPKASRWALSAAADAGLMKITTPGKWPFAVMGDSASLKPGTWCLAIGPVAIVRGSRGHHIVRYTFGERA